MCPPNQKRKPQPFTSNDVTFDRSNAIFPASVFSVDSAFSNSGTYSPVKHSQQCDLHFRTQLADFIEKNRSTVGCLKPSDTLLQCAGERALLMPKQFAGDQLYRLLFDKRLQAGQSSIPLLRNELQIFPHIFKRARVQFETILPT